MDNKEKPRLQILITSGPEAVDRVVFALNLALTAASSNIPVVVFFTLGATLWSCVRASKEVEGGEQVTELIDAVIAIGGRFESCSACMQKYCAGPAAEGPGGLREGIRPSGLATLVRRAASGVNTLTF